VDVRGELLPTERDAEHQRPTSFARSPAEVTPPVAPRGRPPKARLGGQANVPGRRPGTWKDLTDNVNLARTRT